MNNGTRRRCPDCAFERLTPFSCKARAVCPSCRAKRSAAQTAHLVDRVLPDVPVRQWVLSLPFDLRTLVSVTPELHGPINRIFIDEIMRHYGHDGRGQWGGAISVIQRFGAALNLHVHFHVLAFDGTYEVLADALEFRVAPRPTPVDVEVVCERVAERVARILIEGGYIDGDDLVFADVVHEPRVKSGWLLADGEVVEAPPIQRSAVGTCAAEHRGFSVHAGVEIGATDADGRERLARYVTRPPFAAEQVQRTKDGRVAFRLGHPKPTGETHVFFPALQFLRRVISQIPPLGMNLVRYHGVLAPAAKLRANVVRSSPPRRANAPTSAGPSAMAPSLSWAALLRRVFNVDVLVCPQCAGPMQVISAIEDPKVIARILDHLGITPAPTTAEPSRAHDLFEPVYADTG